MYLKDSASFFYYSYTMRRKFIPVILMTKVSKRLSQLIKGENILASYYWMKCGLNFKKRRRTRKSLSDIRITSEDSVPLDPF